MSQLARRSYRLPTVFQVRSVPGNSASQMPVNLFSLYAVPEDVGIVPTVVKGDIFASFLAVLVCHIEWLLIADTSDNFQIFFGKSKITVVFLGKLVDRILGIVVQPSHIQTLN